MTAVQFLIQSLQAAFPNEMYAMKEKDPDFLMAIIKDSDGIHREQIENAYNQGYRDGESDGYMNGDKDISNFSNATFYYNETYTP